MVATSQVGSPTGVEGHAGAGSISGKLQCVVVTPETTALDQPAEFVVLPLYDGEIGIAPGHSPFIGRLGYGEMRITTAGQVSHYYVDGGFVQVADNIVSVLTNRAVPAASLDAKVADENLTAAINRPANNDELLAIRERLQAQARAQLRVANRRH